MRLNLNEVFTNLRLATQDHENEMVADLAWRVLRNAERHEAGVENVERIVNRIFIGENY